MGEFDTQSQQGPSGKGKRLDRENNKKHNNPKNPPRCAKINKTLTLTIETVHRDGKVRDLTRFLQTFPELEKEQTIICHHRTHRAERCSP